MVDLTGGESRTFAIVFRRARIGKVRMGSILIEKRKVVTERLR